MSRRYEQRLRAAATEERRRRVLATVFEGLREAPSRPLGLDEIAQRAGLSRSTIYGLFGSRAGVFDALGESLVDRLGYARLIETVDDPDARTVLRRVLAESTRIYAEHRDVQRALYSLAALDDEAAGGPMRRLEHDRAAGMRRLAEGLADQDALRPGLGVDDAAHLLWMLTSFESFDLLHTGRRLPVDEVARLLVLAADRIAAPGAAGRHRPSAVPEARARDR